MDADHLAAAELEMLAAMAEAGARLRASMAWLKSADRDLSALEPGRWYWDAPVADSWARAREAVAESLEACEAWEHFCG